MSETTFDAALIVSFKGVIDILGLDQDDCKLLIRDRILQGRDAYYALMSLDHNETNAAHCISWGEYDVDSDSIIRDGRIKLCYLIDCLGMSVAFNNMNRDAEKCVIRRSGDIETFATNHAESGGGFRLGAAQPQKRVIAEATNVMLHERQWFDEQRRTQADVDADKRQIQEFFAGGNEYSAKLVNAAMSTFQDRQNIVLSPAALKECGLAQVVPDTSALYESAHASLRQWDTSEDALMDVFFRSQLQK
jgi:hypothetical protein